MRRPNRRLPQQTLQPVSNLIQMVNIKKIAAYVGVTAFAIMAVLGIGAITTKVANANPSFTAPTAQTAAATSTLAYMTPGTATTTLVYDAYASSTASGGLALKADNVALGIQFTASSSSSVLATAIEYSEDGIDWYRDFVFGTVGTATTSTVVALTSPVSLTMSGTSKSLVLIPTPTRYTRFTFSLTGANGGVWAQAIPTKQLR